jgi:tripartite-type tricarboxylate transporter receptor subunit TctC
VSKKVKRISVLLLVVIVASMALIGAGCKPKLAWPEKTINLICCQGAGGGTDTAVRGIQPFLQKALGVSVMIENRTGGAGLVTTNYVWDQPSDGYTVIAGHNTLVLSTALYADAYKPDKPIYEAFIPLYAWMTGDGNGVFVSKDSPFQSMDALAAEAQKRKVICALAAGAGSLDHLTFLQMTKAYPGNWEWVPFDSAGEAAAAVLGGHCDIGMAGIAGSGVDLTRLTMLALTTPERFSGLPDVPTFAEMGHPEMNLQFIIGSYVKADTPPEIVERLKKAFADAFNDPGYKAWAQQANKPIGEGMDSEQWKEYLVWFDGVIKDLLPMVKADIERAQGK